MVQCRKSRLSLSPSEGPSLSRSELPPDSLDESWTQLCATLALRRAWAYRDCECSTRQADVQREERIMKKAALLRVLWLIVAAFALGLLPAPAFAQRGGGHGGGGGFHGGG